MVALRTRYEELPLKPQSAVSWESFRVSALNEMKEVVLRQLSPEPEAVPLTCEKTPEHRL
jgi:hypothetical protein